jgi:hypothetical protein
MRGKTGLLRVNAASMHPDYALAGLPDWSKRPPSTTIVVPVTKLAPAR